MVKRLAMLMTSLFLLVGGVLAQSTISGTVTSSDDGDPIVGASVVIEGTKTVPLLTLMVTLPLMLSLERRSVFPILE